MQAVEDKMEIVHLYVVREKEKKSYAFLPLLCALFCLVGIVAVTLYSAQHPYYEYKRLTIPAQFLPLRTFTAQAPIIPTGIQAFPATYAEGVLTLTNGSVLSEVLPLGVIFGGASGVEVQTEQAVFLPAGNATGYGVATVRAKAVEAGRAGNIRALAVNAVYGTALYVRNLTAFMGGRDSYSIPVVIPRDTQTALHAARAALSAQKAQIEAILASPCREVVNRQPIAVKLTAKCQFVTYHVPSDMRVVAARLSGKHFLIDVAFIPRPQRIWVK